MFRTLGNRRGIAECLWRSRVSKPRRGKRRAPRSSWRGGGDYGSQRRGLVAADHGEIARTRAAIEAALDAPTVPPRWQTGAR